MILVAVILTQRYHNRLPLSVYTFVIVFLLLVMLLPSSIMDLEMKEGDDVIAIIMAEGLLSVGFVITGLALSTDLASSPFLRNCCRFLALFSRGF